VRVGLFHPLAKFCCEIVTLVGELSQTWQQLVLVLAGSFCSPLDSSSKPLYAICLIAFCPHPPSLPPPLPLQAPCLA